MPDTLELLLLAVALAMDCFTVSTVCGVILRRRQWRTILLTAFFFGAFQAFMPYIGWLGTSLFAHQLEAYDHWIAFSLLLFLGGKMIRESFLPEERQSFCPTSLRTQLVLAVATSIDALAIGISFACTGYRSSADLAEPLTIIGLVSALFSVIGYLLGIRFGSTVTRRIKPELLGGLIPRPPAKMGCNSTRRELQPILVVGHQVRCPCLARGEAYRREADLHSRDHPADGPGAYRREPCRLVCAYPDGRSCHQTY